MLEIAVAAVFNLRVHAHHDPIEHAGRDDRLTRCRKLGHPRGEVDAVTVHILVVGVEVGGVDPCPQMQLARIGEGFVERCEVLVQRERSTHRIGWLVKFHQHAVTQALDHATSASRQHDGGGVVHEASPLVHHRSFVGSHQTHGFHEIDHQHHLVALLGKRWNTPVGGRFWGG